MRACRRRVLRGGLALAGLGLLAGCGLAPPPGAARGGHHIAYAVGRYLALHPEAGSPAAALEAHACRACGAAVAPVRRSAWSERGHCRRCDRAEDERRRYREDPAYRARKLARQRARRRARAGG
jgi:hypothetical protein